MEFEMQPYKVYIKIDEQKRVIEINSDAFITLTDEWIYIDEGYGDKYHHAQGNYLPGPLCDNRGRYNFKYINNEILERSEDEKALDYSKPEIPDATNTLETRVASLEAQLASYEVAYMEGVNEA